MAIPKELPCMRRLLSRIRDLTLFNSLVRRLLTAISLFIADTSPSYFPFTITIVLNHRTYITQKLILTISGLTMYSYPLLYSVPSFSRRLRLSPRGPWTPVPLGCMALCKSFP